MKQYFMLPSVSECNWKLHFLVNKSELTLVQNQSNSNIKTIFHWFLTWSKIIFLWSEVTLIMEQTDFWLERSDQGQNDHKAK